MADVQIAVIDQQNTQIALAAPSETQVNAAVPGIQGPVGEGVPAGGTANQVLFKQSGTDYDTAWSSVTSAMIGDLEIVDADVAAAAAIAGTKISPDFGAQNVVTTGTVTGASLNPTSSTVPTNGVYLPSANNVAISTNGTGRLFVDADGKVGIAGTPSNPLDVFGSATLGICYKSSGSYGGIVADNTSSTGGGYFVARQNGSQKAVFGVTGAFIGDTSSDAGLLAETGQAIRFFTNGSVTEKARITSDGKLGLGTSSPRCKLEVSDGTSNTAGEAVNEAYIVGATTGSSEGILTIQSNDAMASDKGGSIAFGGRAVTSSAAGANWAFINGYKENGTTANYGGYLSFATRPNSGSISERMRIDSSGNVGVGTTSASSKLHVVNPSGSLGTTEVSTIERDNSGYLLKLYRNAGSGNPGGLIGADSAGTYYTGGHNTQNQLYIDGGNAVMQFYTNNSERARIDSSGRLGIGTSSVDASSRLHVKGQQVLFESASGGSGFTLKGTDPSGNPWRIGHLDTVQSLQFSCNNVLSQMTLDSSGRLGIGTTPSNFGSNNNALQIHSGSSTASYLSLTNTTTTSDGANYGLNLIASGNDGKIYLRSNGALTFDTNSTERARIDSSGRLGIGTSSPSSYNANGDNLVVFDSGSAGITIAAGSASYGSLYFADGTTGAQAYAGYVQYNHADDKLYIGSGADNTITCDSSQRVGIGTTSPAELLHVNGSSAGGSIAALVENTSITADSDASINLKTYSRTWRIVSKRQDGRLDFVSNSDLRASFDNSGRFLVGTSSYSKNATIVAQGYSADSTGPAHVVLNTGNTTPGDSGYSNDLGYLFFSDSGTSGYGAWIVSQRDGGTWTSGSSMPSRLVFSTTADGSPSPTERLRIDSSGRVGIGTTSPNSNGLLTIAGNLVFPSASQGLVDDTGNPILQRITGGNIDIANGGWNNVRLYTASTERARIDSSGRLLVGTSSARSNFYNTSGSTTALQVEGTNSNTSGLSIVANTSGNANAPRLVFGKSAGTTIGSNTLVALDENLGRIAFQGNDGTEFVQAGEIRCDVDGTPGADDMPGRLVFSTTADGASSPTERMRITSTGNANFFAQEGVVYSRSAAAAGTAQRLFIGYYGAASIIGGTISFNVYTNGDVTNTNNSYGAISDIKLKENIVDANSQWDDIKALQVRNYNFKEGQTHTQLGLIAQEVELVSPGLVSESPDRDEDGNDLGTVTKSVNYSVLYMKAVKALQEAMERIETLEASNTDLLARVSALESA